MIQNTQSLSYYAPRSLWRLEQQTLHQAHAKAVRKLGGDLSKGKRPHAVMRNFLRNPQVKRAAILKASKGKIDRDTTFALADQMELYARQDHVIQTFSLRKNNGGTRTICVLPTELAAKHKIILTVLDAMIVRNPNLYGVKEFGREHAAQHIQNLQQDGYSEIWQTDIVDCFASVNLEALSALPLPQRVISNALDTRNHHFSFQALSSKSEAKKGASPDTPDAATPEDHSVQGHSPIASYTDDIVCNTRGPSGLMQGSPASSAILAWHLNGVLNDLPLNDDVQVIVCFDNLLVASRCEEASRMIRNTLADSLGRGSFGPLTLHQPSSCDPVYGMDFLGYNFSADGCSIGISDSSRAKLMRRLSHIEIEFEKNRDEPVPFVFEVWKALLGFANGHSGSTDIGAETAEFVEGSAWIPAATNDPRFIITHQNLFADKEEWERHFLHSFMTAMRSIDPSARKKS